MPAISPDMQKRPLSAKTEAALCPDTSRPTGRNLLIMAHPARDHITVPADKLQAIANAASHLFCEASLLLDEAGVATGATAPRHPLPADGNVFDLSVYRLHRHGGAA